MARTMTMESIDAKIQKAEEKVVRTGKTYNTACEELKKLTDKKAAIENEALVEAFMRIIRNSSPPDLQRKSPGLVHSFMMFDTSTSTLSPSSCP